MDNNIKITTPQLQNAKYLVLDYIQSTGTQYIKTGIKANTSYCRIEAKVAYDAFVGSLFGHYNGNTTYARGLVTGPVAAYAGTTKISKSVTDNDFHVFDLEYANKIAKYGIDGNYTTTSASGIDGTYEDYLLAFNDINGVAFYTKARLSYFKIYNGSSTSLVRDFVPAIRWSSDLAIGLYDKVNDVFYANVGSGTFGKGNVIGTIK